MRVGGARPPPLITFTLTTKVGVYAPAEWADTLTLFHLYQYVYSVITTVSNCTHIVYTESQSIQSARLFLQSSEWGPPNTPSPEGDCVPPPGTKGGGGGIQLLAGNWVGGSIRTRGQTLWYSRYICTFCPEVSDVITLLKLYNLQINQQD